VPAQKAKIISPGAQRYTNYIPTQKDDSGNLDLPFFIFKDPFLGFQFDTRFPDTIGWVYPKSICNIGKKVDSW
jgi:hypothetical protein